MMIKPEQNSLLSRQGDHAIERALGERDMRHLMPPRAPLSMPQQDLTPRVGLRRALSMIGLVVAGR